MSEIEELIKTISGEEKNEGEGLSLNDILVKGKDVIQFLWSKKWIVIIAGILGGVIGLVYAFNKVVKYDAHYTFTVGSSNSHSGTLGGLSSLLNFGGGSMDAFSGDNVLELLKSRALLEKTLLSPTVYQGDSITFMEYALICDSTRAKCEKSSSDKASSDKGITSICDVSYPLGQDRSTFSRAQDSILNIFAETLIKNNINVYRRDKKLSFMEYSFYHTNEDFAKAFSTAHLNEVCTFHINTKTSLARRNINSFQQKADSIRRDLDRSLSKRAAYSDGNRNANGLMTAVNQLKLETDIQILGTTYTEMTKNIEMLKLDLARETPLINIIDGPIKPLPNDKTRKMKSIVIGGFIGGFLSCIA